MSSIVLSLPLLATAVAEPAGIALYCPTEPPPAAAAPAVIEVGGPPVPGDAAKAAQSVPAPSTDPAQAGNAQAAADDPSETDPGGIVVTGRAPSREDPAEKINLVTYAAVQAVDSAVIEPITNAYSERVPGPLRDGLHNVLSNLDEPVVFVNFMLQLKPGKAVETLGRFVINSTIGLGGLFDVAKKKPFNLPRRSNGLADTLAFYGVPSGPYLYLPLIGPTTLRDVIARPFDLALLPAIFPKPFAKPAVALGKGVASALDERYQNDRKLKLIKEAADPYLAMREEYLARRRAEVEVLKGKRANMWDPPYYTVRGSAEQCERVRRMTAPLAFPVVNSLPPKPARP